MKKEPGKRKRRTQTNPNSLANLIPITSKNAREMGKKGGPAAAEARKRNNTIAKIAQKIANTDIPQDANKTRKELERMGIEVDEMTYNTAIAAALAKKATEGSVQAIELWDTYTSGMDDKEQLFELPARVMVKSFVDINREIRPNKTYEFYGGRASGKSSYIPLKAIELMKNHKNLHMCVVRKVGATLKDSVYSKLTWAIETLGMADEWQLKVSPLEMVNKNTGQTIYFRGTDKAEKLKSIAPPFGYIGILWVEELDQLAGAKELRSIEQSVLRGGPLSYEFLSYNPPKSKSSWVNKERLKPNENRVLHWSTYQDVPEGWLGDKFILDAEHLKEVNPEEYEHEYLGVANGDGGAVFEYLELRDITDEEIAEFDRLYAGVDWGFYPDPYAFILCHYNPANEKIYIIDEYYAKKQKNKDTAQWIKDNHPELLEQDISGLQYGIVCDSAENKSIADYWDLDIWNAVKAKKGPGSVEYGMKWLQGKTIVIDQKRTPHAYEEFTEYEYERDKDGDVISGYPDANNHCIDALRYALSPIFMQRFNA